MECPKCRREINRDIPPSDLVFCPYCGENIALRNEEEFSFCPSCGQKLPPSAVFCPYCGKSTKLTERLRVKREPLNHSITPEPAEQHGTHSREYIAELVNVEPAEPPGQPPSPAQEDIRSLVKEEHGGTATIIQQTIKIRIVKMLEPLRDFVSGQWQLRRLYRKWAKDGVFTPGEIPSTETLNQITRDAGKQPPQPARPVFVIVAGIIFVAFFVAIGVTMGQCR